MKTFIQVFCPERKDKEKGLPQNSVLKQPSQPFNPKFLKHKNSSRITGISQIFPILHCHKITIARIRTSYSKMNVKLWRRIVGLGEPFRALQPSIFGLQSEAFRTVVRRPSDYGPDTFGLTASLSNNLNDAIVLDN